MYPGLWKLAKNEFWYFFGNSCNWVYKKWLKLKFVIFPKIVYENWPKMKFVIILKIHVPGSMEIGQKWSFWFFQKFMYLGLWKSVKNELWYFIGNSKLAKNEVWYFLKNSRTWVYENWLKLKFDIFIDPGKWIFKKITDFNFSHFL